MTRELPLIAVIDDDAAYIDATVAVLEDAGYVCISALTDQDALPLIQRHRPDLVILDLRIHFPDSGLRILEGIRHTPAIAHLPVLICSGDRATLRTKAAWFRAHGCDILEKPFAPKELLTKGQRLLAAHSV